MKGFKVMKKAVGGIVLPEQLTRTVAPLPTARAAPIIDAKPVGQASIPSRPMGPAPRMQAAPPAVRQRPMIGRRGFKSGGKTDK